MVRPGLQNRTPIVFLGNSRTCTEYSACSLISSIAFFPSMIATTSCHACRFEGPARALIVCLAREDGPATDFQGFDEYLCSASSLVAEPPQAINRYGHPALVGAKG